MRYFPGGYAVSLFFVLSGLLITWLLLKELDRSDSIDFKQFYARRSLRLFPAFYATWILALFTLRTFSSKWATLFYVCDYYLALGAPYDPLTLSWSLGVEEKFYLLWPLFLAKVKRQTLLWAVPIVIVADQIYKETMNVTGRGRYAAFAFDTNLDCVLMGCFIALLAHYRVRFPNWLGNPLVPIAAIVSLYTCNEIVVHYLLALTLVWAIIKQPLLLNNRPIRYLGLISYSLYLCHLVVQSAVWWPLLAHVHFPRWSLQLLSKIAVALVCASILHYGIERPFLRLKDRFHKKGTQFLPGE